MDSFKERLAKLKEQRRQASRDNFREVLEENERQKRPQNWEKKLERDFKKLEDEEAKQKAEAAGQDHEIIKSMSYRADEIEKWERSRAGRKRAQVGGFVDFEDATKRQYGRFVKQHKPDLEEYNALKDELGDDKFYLKDSSASDDAAGKAPTASSSSSTQIQCAPKDTPQGVERMVEEVQKEINIRSKRSRRRKFNDDADVNYINERNKKYNEKLERFYGSYTDEIKKNFERGTAM